MCAIDKLIMMSNEEVIASYDFLINIIIIIFFKYLFNLAIC